MNENLSSLIDNEISDDDLQDVIDELLLKEQESGDSNKAISRYQLIGHVIRNDVTVLNTDMTQRISAALDAEDSKSNDKSNVIGRTGHDTFPKDAAPVHSDTTAVWKSAGLMAMAASLVAIALISTQPSVVNSRDTNQQNLISQHTQQTTQEDITNTDEDRMAQEFGEMLVEHGEFSSTSGLNGLLSYAKLVSNESINRP